ncbi:MAG: hypothetical protein LUE87_05820, partial [Lachnospiraceae bacterium]|nr:hypothetical protein [Lachnospiraceae bacterium]
MKEIISINDGWTLTFPKGERPTEVVDIPHTWNAVDGQDGGNDYYRGTCWYVRELEPVTLQGNEEVWLKFEGAAMTADVYLNGVHLAHHEGGYSTFYVNLTEHIAAPANQGTSVCGTACVGKEQSVSQKKDSPVFDTACAESAQTGSPDAPASNILAVAADNSDNDRVYPQKADFTFYGGLYRPVSLLTVPKAHFSFADGAHGLKVTPVVSHDYKSATVMLESTVDHAEGQTVTFLIFGQPAIPGNDAAAASDCASASPAAVQNTSVSNTAPILTASAP